MKRIVTSNVLHTTITDMAALSEEGFSKIEAIADLCLIALHEDSGIVKMHTLAAALSTISGIAAQVGNSVAVEAENVAGETAHD